MAVMPYVLFFCLVNLHINVVEQGGNQTVLSSATRIQCAAIDYNIESDIYTVEGNMFHQATMKY